MKTPVKTTSIITTWLVSVLIAPVVWAQVPATGQSGKESPGKESPSKNESVVRPENDRALEQRIEKEVAAMMSPFTLIPHKVNYFAPYSRTFRPMQVENYIDDTLESALPPSQLEKIKTDSVEFEFQLSVKTPIMTKMFGDRGTLMGAYTHRSLWQARTLR